MTQRIRHTHRHADPARARRATLWLAAMAAMGAMANPQNPQVISGQAAFQTQGKQLTVTNTPGAIIHWQSFSIDRGELTRFVQQNAASLNISRKRVGDPAHRDVVIGI
jgi:hypothetical protein